MIHKGQIYLIGCGPGDVELLTLKAHRLIQEADIVLADRLVPRSILNVATGVIYIAEKKIGHADEAQAKLDFYGLAGLKSGKLVVRLKNGDAFLFGRGGEEMKVYGAYGYMPIVVPGISSSMAAPSSANIPVTLRNVANQVLIVTGHGRKDTFVDMPQYVVNRTLVILMGIGRIDSIQKQLLLNGFPSTIKCAVIESATLKNEKKWISNLKELRSLVVNNNIQPPATIVIGHVVNALEEYKVSYPAVEQVDMGFEKKNKLNSRYWYVMLMFAVAVPSYLGVIWR